ncbi:MAG: citrate transporter [Deltaproteobacteria bacterium]|nr:citrate transporter [Deltaproteobacteria bacterium]
MHAVDVFGIPLDFVLFGLTLMGVALFHAKTLQVALAGLGVLTVYKVFWGGFAHGSGLEGLAAHLGHEWVVLANLLGLLIGFALLSRHFEQSKVPALLPALLPDGWEGGFAMLAMVFVLSSFLDNIAAALIGGAMAHTLFRGKVHVGYLAGIVAASNAGGSGSVVGDTTTTMMWIAHKSPLDVLHAYVAAAAALMVFGIPAALQQHRYSPILADPPEGTKADFRHLAVVLLVLLAAVTTNVVVNTRFPAAGDRFPWLGAAVTLAVVLCAPIRAPDWKVVPDAAKGAVFLLSLVTCASMMPVDRLPGASWHTSMGLGFLSAVFDNIPLTALALKQGGYDWGMLAYAVGFGGSMIWFGSSAGVAISNMYPEAKSVGSWLRNGWHVTVAYVVGFLVLLAVNGWVPEVGKGP